jgi:hypothetical protein
MLELPEGAAAGVLDGALGAGALELEEEVELESDDDDDDESDELEVDPEDESGELEPSDFADPLAGEALLILSRESLR